MRRILALAIIVFLTSGASFAQENQALGWQDALAEIETVVAELRGLAAIKSTPVSFLSRDEAATHIERWFDNEYTSERLARLYHLYRALDLAEPGLDLSALLLDFHKSAVAGYYDADDATMYIILPDDPLGAMLPLTQELTYIHEFTHALQDQHFDLNDFMESNSNDGDLDGQLALSALVEGDATHMALLFLVLLHEDDERIRRRPGSEADMPPAPPAKLPRIMLSEIDFRYWEGKRFVEQLVNARGWAVVNRAFRENPPGTSEQIMHPERYLQGQAAIPIEIPDLADIAGDGWRVVFESAVGEFYLLHHLETQVNKPHSARYANGWGGDSMRIYIDEAGDEMMWIWHQVWDRPKDAEQFAEGYAYFLDHRYYGRYRGGAADAGCWMDAVASHCFARVSEIETRISMAPDREAALALLNIDD